MAISINQGLPPGLTDFNLSITLHDFFLGLPVSASSVVATRSHFHPMFIPFIIDRNILGTHNFPWRKGTIQEISIN